MNKYVFNVPQTPYKHKTTSHGKPYREIKIDAQTLSEAKRKLSLKLGQGKLPAGCKMK